MHSYLDGKPARPLLQSQDQRGLWGESFHALSAPRPGRLWTTERALRRLWIRGFTVGHPQIRRTVDFLRACLGQRRSCRTAGR